MYYEINVSLNGSHFFATSSRSITSLSQCKIVYKALKGAFPVLLGYTITVTHYATVGEPISMED